MHSFLYIGEVTALNNIIHQPVVMQLLQEKMAELINESDGMDGMAVFIILEPTDDLQALQIEVPVFTDDGDPLWEVVEEHESCYELVFVLSSDGSGAIVFAPKESCHPEILALCQKYAYRGPPHPPPADALPSETAHRGGFFMPTKPEEPNEAS